MLSGSFVHRVLRLYHLLRVAVSGVADWLAPCSSHSVYRLRVMYLCVVNQPRSHGLFPSRALAVVGAVVAH